MGIGDLARSHCFRHVAYLSGDAAVSGTLHDVQTVEPKGHLKQITTISGWVSPALDFDVMEVQTSRQ